MAKIGQANVFHEFLDFSRLWAGPRRFFGNHRFMEHIGQVTFNEFWGPELRRDPGPRCI